MISDKNYEEQRRGRADRSDSIFHWAEQSIAGVGEGGGDRDRGQGGKERLMFYRLENHLITMGTDMLKLA